MEYSPHEETLKYDLKKLSSLSKNRMFRFNEFVANIVDGIIPVNYEYKISYENHKNLLNFIEQPMNCNEISYLENNVKDKIVIFHGLNRYGTKGTRHIEKAFKILAEKYPQELELIIDGNMPLDEYMNFMKEVNIVVDQTYSYSLGANCLYALAMGKVVLGGVEPESLECMQVSSSPAINIKPDVNNIVSEIENLIRNKSKIKQIGSDSRKFVENFHGHIKIAHKYVDTWQELFLLKNICINLIKIFKLFMEFCKFWRNSNNRFFCAAIIARIASPADFGLIAICSAIIFICNLLSEGGLSSLLVINKDFSTEKASTILIMVSFLSLLIFCILISFTEYLAIFLDNENIVLVLPLMSLTILANGFGCVHSAILLRNLELKKITLFSLFSVSAASIIGLLVAYEYDPLIGLVIAFILNPILYTICVWIFAPWGFDFSFIKIHLF